MLSSRTSSSCSNYTNSKQRKHFSIERRPRMLKDFLVDDAYSCSSSGFTSFPRRVEDLSMRNLIEIDLNIARNNSYSSSTKRLLRSRSKAAASTTISAFQAIINTVRSLQFNTVKSPSILPRSLSRRLSKKHHTHNKSTENKESEVKITIRIKDIIRWKSFRDLVEETPQPSDLASSPDHHCATTTTGSTNSSCSNSNASSWCDSDFTSEDSPSWCGNSEDYLPGVGSDSMKATKVAAADTVVGPKELSSEEKEQRSPVSVLDFQFEEDEDSLSSFNRTLDNMEKTNQKIMQRIRRFEGLAKVDPLNLEKWMSMEENDNGSDEDKEVNEVEEKAMLLLSHVKATSSTGNCEANVVEQLLLDFFTDELSTKRNQTRNDEMDGEMIRQATKWITGEHSTAIDWEEYVREMGRKFGKWNKFEEEREEMVVQIEIGMLNLLVDELLADLLSC